MSTTPGLTFDGIGLHVDALEPALHFFAGLLQLEILPGVEADDPILLAGIGRDGAPAQAGLRFPGTSSEIRLIANPGAPHADGDHANPGTCHVCFYTDDLDATWRVLEEAGTRLCSSGVIRIVGGVFDGGKCIYCVGPDGFRIEFLEGPAYLDGTRRDPAGAPPGQRANEASHIGLHVRDRDVSLRFYRDMLGIEEVAGWLERTESTRSVIGYPAAELWMSILRLPGTQSFFEIIEYRGTNGRAIDNSMRSNGSCHLSFAVDDLGELREKLRASGVTILQPDDEAKSALWCVDPDGYRVRFSQRDAGG